MKDRTKDIQKKRGIVYTPDHIVKNILDLSSYYGNIILKKNVIDNSCGDGAFLCQIVDRYCKEAISYGLTPEEVRYDLSVFIHGIEIDKEEVVQCIKNVNAVAALYGVVGVDWDIICGDALNICKYDRKMDFVFGNPPYVRVHNLGDSLCDVKRFTFAQNGMTDLFIVFYEIGIKMLSPNGVLGYIAPSSFHNTLAAKFMRQFFVNQNLLDKIVNLKHYQVFDVTTYSAITILKRGRTKKTTDYYEYSAQEQIPYYIDTLKADDYFIAGDYYFANRVKLSTLHKILYNLGQCNVEVKNGYATLSDDTFVHNFDFESKFIIPVVKSSRGIRQKIFFPYDTEGNLLSEEMIKSDIRIYNYLLNNKDRLLKRNNEKDSDTYWYAFGRSQAIKDTFKDKLAINSLLRTEKDLKFTEAPCGTGVYGGLYIVSNSIPLEDIKNALKNEEFIKYVMLLGKYKSGGYYTFSSKDVKKYLDYKFNYYGGLLYAE